MCTRVKSPQSSLQTNQELPWRAPAAGCCCCCRYYAHEQDCVKANAVFNERLLTAGGYFSGCQASVLGTHYFPTFRDQATCEVARPILDKFLSTNTTLADLIMSAA